MEAVGCETELVMEMLSGVLAEVDKVSLLDITESMLVKIMFAVRPVGRGFEGSLCSVVMVVVVVVMVVERLEGRRMVTFRCHLILGMVVEGGA